jgi:hypothetical protein
MVEGVLICVFAFRYPAERVNMVVNVFVEVQGDVLNDELHLVQDVLFLGGHFVDDVLSLADDALDVVVTVQDLQLFLEGALLQFEYLAKGLLLPLSVVAINGAVRLDDAPDFAFSFDCDVVKPLIGEFFRPANPLNEFAVLIGDFFLQFLLLLMQEGEDILAGVVVLDAFFNDFLLVVNFDYFFLMGIALLLDALDAFELVSPVLSEDGAFCT